MMIFMIPGFKEEESMTNKRKNEQTMTEDGVAQE